MFKFRLLNPKKTAKRLESREDYVNLLNKWGEIEEVTHQNGYKEAFSYFEDKINDMYRNETVNFAEIKGIESVFSFFDGARKRREELEKSIKEWDEVGESGA